MTKTVTVKSERTWTDERGVLHPAGTVDLRRHYLRMMSVLRLHGIPVSLAARRGVGVLTERPANRYYCLQLYQHHVLGVYRAETAGAWLHADAVDGENLQFFPVQTSDEEPEGRRVRKLAVRALYAMGLESGTVLLAADSPTRLRVVDVQARLSVPGAPDQEFCRRVNDWRTREEQGQQTERQEIVIGADPEFALRDPQGNMGVASDFLGRHGTVGCDAARIRGEQKQRLPLVEIRPLPSEQPELVFLSIQDALVEAKQRITDPTLEWIAGGMPFPGYPIGGHIHFSGVPLSFWLIRSLDTYLTLPLALIEDAGCLTRRPRYGFLGDFREQPYGGFEYRTPPSWLVSPLVTRGVLHLAKLVAANFRQLKQQPLRELHVQKAYYQGNKDVLRPIVASLWEELTMLRQYDSYREALVPFFRYLFTGKVWPAEVDMRRTWGLLV